MPPKVKVECSVPLLCNLCPKSPTFSDISHLLTHISSKSHLANLFKLKIRAQGEQEAKDKLDDFELWYNDNNLDALLSDRLAAKDQKKASKDRKNRLSGASKASVKKEEERSAKSALDTTPVFRAPVPRMGRWNNSANKNSTSLEDDWGANSLYDTPTTRRRVPNFADDDTPSGTLLDPKLGTPFKASPAKKSKSGEKIPDSAQLKGILWPGMDLFDSATNDMKRMRNQRKSSNVMRQMMATSAEIEPAEISYFADGEFRGSRDIFGPLSGENSPVKEPSPKKTRRARKPTFSDVSVNAPRSRTSRGKRITGKSPEKQFSSMHNPIPASGLFLKPTPTLNPLASGSAFGQHFAPTSEEDEEFKMTVGEMKKKRTFGVFQEAPGESPSGQTESSLEDHRFDFPSHGLPLYQNNSTSISHTSPTPAPKPVSARGFGKENMQSTMHGQMHARQPNPYVSHVYPSQVFHNPSFNPLYNHAYAGSFEYGEHHNNFDMKPPTGFAQNFYGDFKPIASTSRVSQRQHKSGNANESGSASGSGTNGM